MDLAEAIVRVLESPGVVNSNGEDANIVDVVASLAMQAKRIANAITPGAVAGSIDAAGVHVESLTEAVMGMTAGLVRIADAISDLASAVRERSA